MNAALTLLTLGPRNDPTKLRIKQPFFTEEDKAKLQFIFDGLKGPAANMTDAKIDSIMSKLSPIMAKLKREAIFNKQVAKVENKNSEALQLLIDFDTLVADYEDIKAARRVASSR